MIEFKGFSKGVNLGGWLSQCGKNYTEEHYRSFITREDIKRIASWGTDHVRLPFDYNVIQKEEGGFLDAGFSHIDDCLSWCEEFGLNVVLDLHKTKGFVFDDKNDCNFFTDEALIQLFIDLWIEMAKRYGAKKNVVFELLNEVTTPDMAEPWNRIIERTVPQIRKITADMKIIVGGIYNNSIYGISLLKPPMDSNMVFTFHCYSPFIFTHQSAPWVEKMPAGFHMVFPESADVTMRASESVFGSDFSAEFQGLGSTVLGKDYFKRLFKPAIATVEKYGIPVYCGEYGVIDRADTESTKYWYQSIHQAFVECVIGRCAWTYRDMDFGISSFHYKEIREEVIANL